MLLAAILLGAGKIRLPGWPSQSRQDRGCCGVSAGVLLLPSTASAQLPDQDLLETLRQRLLETPDAFPNAAEIPSVDLTIE